MTSPLCCDAPTHETDPDVLCYRCERGAYLTRMAKRCVACGLPLSVMRPMPRVIARAKPTAPVVVAPIPKAKPVPARVRHDRMLARIEATRAAKDQRERAKCRQAMQVHRAASDRRIAYAARRTAA